MSVLDSIVEAWFTKAIGIYPEPVRDGLMQAIKTPDRFRNPVACGLRESLEVLASEVAGDMDPNAIIAAMDGIIRIRAVQQCSQDEAIAFAPQLGDVIREQRAEALFPHSEQRVRRLADYARQQYAACRKDVARIRQRQEWRLQALEPWMLEAQ